MASVFKRGKRWYVRVRDGSGKWISRASTARSRQQAIRLAVELEQRHERVRLGLEAPAPESITFGALVDFWLEEYGRHLESKSAELVIEKWLRPPLGELPLRDVTSSRVEGLINAARDKLGPRSLNGLRAHVHRLFEVALRRGLWIGKNPADDVPRFRVPKRLPTFLRWDEVPLLLKHLDAAWRPLFATALWTGMRRGELLALRRSDLDLAEGTIAVQRSGVDSDTTKGGHADLIPIASQLRPFLAVALAHSKSELVFPGPSQRKARGKGARLDLVLRRALGRAGIVTGYLHVCRRGSCRRTHDEPYEEQAPDAEERRCPRCNMKLWAKPLPRHVRFHDLRHTTATLLLKSGVSLALVQRILRHASPEITARVYGHLEVDDLQQAIEALRWPELPAGELPKPQQQAAEASAGGVAGLSQELEAPKGESPDLPRSEENQGSLVVGTTGFEPATTCTPRVAGHRPDVHESARNTADEVQPRQPVVQPGAALPTTLVAAVSQPARLVALPSFDTDDLLTVREVADRLRVSTATVYALLDRGSLPFVRVASRRLVRAGALQSFISSGGGL